MELKFFLIPMNTGGLACNSKTFTGLFYLHLRSKLKLEATKKQTSNLSEICLFRLESHSTPQAVSSTIHW